MTHVWVPPEPGALGIPDIATKTLSYGTPITTLTTPFVHAPQCTTALGLFNATITTRDPYSEPWQTETWPLLISTAEDARYSACQPNDWKWENGSYNNAYLSPGVCPTSWWALSLTTTSTAGRYLSEGWCCQSGHTLVTSEYWATLRTIIRMGCATTFGPKKPKSTSHSTTKTVIYTDWYGTVQTEAFSRGIFLYPAWRIQWEEKDISTLSPPPPTYIGPYGIPTFYPGQFPISTPQPPWSTYLRTSSSRVWVPGASTATATATATSFSDSSIYNYWVQLDNERAQQRIIRIAVSTTISVLVVALIIWGCWRRRQKKKELARRNTQPEMSQSSAPHRSTGVTRPRTSLDLHDAPPVYGQEAPPPYEPKK